MAKTVRGFYSKKTVKAVKKASATIKSIRAKKEYDCDKCELHKNCQSPQIEPSGGFKKEVLIIAEAPGGTEDEQGIQLVGEAGNLLDERASYYGFNIHEDAIKDNSLRCRPPNNRNPTKSELKCCKPLIDKTIEELKPKFIWLLGSKAVESFYMDRFKHLTITRWRNLCIPDPTTGAWILPMFHPSYILRNPKDKNLNAVFNRDLQFAISCLDKPPPEFHDFEKDIYLLTEYDEIMEALNDIADNHNIISFDYETSSLKPQGPGQRIWSIGVGYLDGETPEAFAFPLAHKDWPENDRTDIEDMWKYILQTKKIRKVAHNLPFEDNWSRVILDIPEVLGWYWCTMNGAHNLDIRKYYSGLKFQAYINYGVPEYDKEADKFKKSQGELGINTFDQMDQLSLLKYNAFDAVLTMKLYRDQIKTMSHEKDGRLKAMQFFVNGLQTCSDMQIDGFPVDMLHFGEQKQELESRIAKLEKKMLNCKESRMFEAHTGRKLEIKNTDFSTNDLRILLFEVMKYPSVKKTGTNLESTDEETLLKIDKPFTRAVLERRKLSKMLSTYINGIIREEVNGKVHPFYYLHTARSFRSSSANPNIHNQPVRIEEQKAIVRKGYIPSPGNKIAEFDYGSQEVKTAACVTKDKNLIKYCKDPTTDMHRDSAMDIWQLPLEEIDYDAGKEKYGNNLTREHWKKNGKMIRFYAKNRWVFTQFYGDWYGSCADMLWSTCSDLETNSGIQLRHWIRDKIGRKGQSSYETLYHHLEEVEFDFWNNRFKGYKEWKEENNRLYRELGYVETVYGFRHGGYLDEKQVNSYPIQGPAFHILLEAVIEVNRIKKRENWGSKLLFEIHDSLGVDTRPDEEEHIIKTVKYVMEEWVVERNPWIIVPLQCDLEMTEVDGSWYTKREVKI